MLHLSSVAPQNNMASRKEDQRFEIWLKQAIVRHVEGGFGRIEAVECQDRFV